MLSDHFEKGMLVSRPERLRLHSFFSEDYELLVMAPVPFVESYLIRSDRRKRSASREISHACRPFNSFMHQILNLLTQLKIPGRTWI
jgi:hypothetical protein